jgi:hypothetical protein
MCVLRRNRPARAPTQVSSRRPNLHLLVASCATRRAVDPSERHGRRAERPAFDSPRVRASAVAGRTCGPAFPRREVSWPRSAQTSCSPRAQPAPWGPPTGRAQAPCWPLAKQGSHQRRPAVACREESGPSLPHLRAALRRRCRSRRWCSRCNASVSCGLARARIHRDAVARPAIDATSAAVEKGSSGVASISSAAVELRDRLLEPAGGCGVSERRGRGIEFRGSPRAALRCRRRNIGSGKFGISCSRMHRTCASAVRRRTRLKCLPVEVSRGYSFRHVLIADWTPARA